MKLFNVNIRKRNLIISFFAIGFLGTEFEASFAASIPLWFGILVYKDFTYKVTRIVSSAMLSNALIFFFY